MKKLMDDPVIALYIVIMIAVFVLGALSIIGSTIAEDKIMNHCAEISESGSEYRYCVYGGENDE